MRIWSVVVVIWICCSVACRKGDVKLVSEDKMVVIMSDMILADHAIRQYPMGMRDSMQNEMMKSLLKLHNLSRDELDTMVYLYSVNYDIYEHVLDGIDARFDSLRNAIIDAPADSLNNQSTGL